MLLAEIADETDRLVAAANARFVAEHRSDVGKLLDRIHVEPTGHILRLAEFLEAGLCTTELAQRRFVYDATDAVANLLKRLRAQGHLDADALPSPPLLSILREFRQMRASSVDALWGDDLDVSLRGAQRAFAACDGYLIDRFRQLSEPLESAHRLHHLLTGLRIARMDAHVEAWQDRGLAAAEIVALSSAVAGASADPVPIELVVRGWLTDDGAATKAGRIERRAIEVDTNHRCGAMLDALDDPRAWLNSLRKLVG